MQISDVSKRILILLSKHVELIYLNRALLEYKTSLDVFVLFTAQSYQRRCVLYKDVDTETHKSAIVRAETPSDGFAATAIIDHVSTRSVTWHHVNNSAISRRKDVSAIL